MWIAYILERNRRFLNLAQSYWFKAGFLILKFITIMEIINHECYVSLEVAKLLKQAGFDWECRGYYDRRILRFNFVWNHDGKGASTQYSAPTLDVAQRWLREVKGYLVSSVLCINRKGKGNSFGFSIGAISEDLSDYRMIYPRSYYDEEDSKDFVKYEPALEAGIEKVLELILEKGE